MATRTITAPHICLGCGSPVATLLGKLGKLTWFRCRDCGIDYNSEGG